MKTPGSTIYTVGHSTHRLVDFISILQSFQIKTVADIRHFPGSKKFPWFNKENIKETLSLNGIHYVHLLGLGGRRKVNKNSINNRWNNDSFRGYADYMETTDFENASNELQKLARKQPTAYMCSEAVWWRCHRAMVSDYLKAKGWKVLHIMATGKAEEHPYTSPARIAGDKVFYFDESLFARHAG
ncbi:MAG: DUF488 domain-containing protein [Bacteroidetes bacterium]|nr:DUF488 domain-containing protein [Bacteroidota bacterium]